LSLTAVVLGYVGFRRYLPGRGVFDHLYYALQLFVLGAPLEDPPYGVALSVAAYLAPLTTVLALLAAVSAAFRRWWEARALRHARGHVVVVGPAPAAVVLARALTQRAGSRVVLVGSGIRKDVARRHGITVVDGESVDETTLRAAGVPGAARVFALAETGAANAAVALLVKSLNSGDVAVHARVDDAGLVAAMRARRLGAEGEQRIRVDFFSIETTAAVALLDEHPPGPEAVVVGSDRFARAVHRELVRRRRQAGGRPPAPIVPCETADDLPAPSGVTYVCGSDADEVLRIGLHLLLHGHPRVVLCLDRRSALAAALEKRLFDRVLGQLSVFGILDAACNPDHLERSSLVEQLARALHAHYLQEYGQPDSGHASHVPWTELDERFRADNREQAEDIGTKLAAIDAIIVPSASGLPAFVPSDDEVEKLAEMEHVRWMADKTRTGIVHGPQRSETTHPDVLPWTELDEGVKEKDRSFVRRLPALLAAEDLAIVRRARG
jgi:hypothetical protein